MILLVGNSKGGCGKSTLVVNIAAALCQQGKDVVIVDADSQQGTASQWAQDRNEKDVPKLNCLELSDNVKLPLIDLGERYEFVLVDAAGHDSRELRTAMLAADILLVPFRPSQPDLDSTHRILNIVNDAKDYNSDLTVKAVLTAAPTNPFIKEAQISRKILSKLPEFSVCKTIIHDRKAYRDTICEGLGVVDWKDQKAKAEIQLLVQELI